MERHYFMGANSHRGFQCVWDETLDKLERVVILSGGPGTGKSSLMKQVGALGKSRGHKAEYWHCASDPDSLDGVYFPDLSAAIIDGTAPHVRAAQYPGVRDFALDLAGGWDWSPLWKGRAQVMGLYEENSAAYKEAYRALHAAQEHRLKHMKCISDCMEEGEGGAFVRDIVRSTVEALPKRSGTGSRFLAYATAITPKGFVSSIRSLTKGVGNLIVLEGEACREKDALMTTADRKARARGYDTRVYLCGLDGKRPDVVHIPEADMAFVDACALHPVKNVNKGIRADFSLLVRPGLYNEKKAEMEVLQKAMNRELKAAVHALRRAKSIHDELEQSYLEVADFSAHEGYLSRAEALLFE